MQAGEAQLSSYLQAERTEIMDSSVEDLQAALGDLLSDVDRAILSGDFAEYLHAGTQAALEHGISGWLDDDLAFFSDWGFDLAAISRPVAIWQGEQDRFVPIGHGRWLAEHVSGASPHLPAEHGHLSLALGCYGRLLDELIAAAG
jgi:pimeloyl-ACP methyl ester carboxylesterase